MQTQRAVASSQESVLLDAVATQERVAACGAQIVEAGAATVPGCSADSAGTLYTPQATGAAGARYRPDRALRLSKDRQKRRTRGQQHGLGLDRREAWVEPAAMHAPLAWELTGTTARRGVALR